MAGFLVPSTDPNLVAIALAMYGSDTDFGAAILANPNFGNPVSENTTNLYIAPSNPITRASFSNSGSPASTPEQIMQNSRNLLASTVPVLSGLQGVLSSLSGTGTGNLLSGGYADFANILTTYNDIFGDNGLLNSFGGSDKNDYNQRFFLTDTPFSLDDPEDIAYFQVVDVKKWDKVIFPKGISEADAPGVSANKFRQFIVHQISEPSQEKIQIIENSEGFNIYMFGSKPEVISISGVLKESQEHPWNTNMIFIWQNLMRATRLAEMDCIFQMYCDGVIYRGYPLNFQRSKVVNAPLTVQFSFNMVLLEGKDGKDPVRLKKMINTEVTDFVDAIKDRSVAEYKVTAIVNSTGAIGNNETDLTVPYVDPNGQGDG